MTKWGDAAIPGIQPGGGVWEVPQPGPYGPNPSAWSAIDESVPYPDLYIGGKNRCAITDTINWTVGRDWWFAAPTGTTAQAVLYGRVADIAVGDSFVVDGAPAGLLWTGRVDDVSYDVQPGGTTTVVTASDWMSRLAALDRPTVSFPAQTLDARVAAMANLAAVPFASRVIPTSSPPPVLIAAANVVATDGILGLLEEYEKSSNAIVAIDADGIWTVMTRSPLEVAVVPTIIPLDGDDCPESADLAFVSPDRLINSWKFAGITPNPVEPVPASITKYGRKDATILNQSASLLYQDPVTDPLNPPIYYKALITVLSNPTRSGTAQVRVLNRTSPLVGMPPFAWVSFDDRVWQVIGQDWEVAPASEGSSEWHVTLYLAITQNDLGQRPVVIPPPVHIVTETQIIAASKDTFVVQSSAGGKYGNGGGPGLLVGKLTDGNLCRALLHFPISWSPGRNRKVLSASLRVVSTTFDCMTPPSSPEITVYRNTAAWSEGSYAASCGWGSGNATVFPGPTVTSSGAVSKPVPKTNTTAVDINVLDIVKAWAAGSPNYGFQLRGKSESNSDDRFEFRPKTGITAHQPTLTIKYTYEE